MEVALRAAETPEGVHKEPSEVEERIAAALLAAERRPKGLLPPALLPPAPATAAARTAAAVPAEVELPPYARDKGRYATPTPPQLSTAVTVTVTLALSTPPRDPDRGEAKEGEEVRGASSVPPPTEGGKVEVRE